MRGRHRFSLFQVREGYFRDCSGMSDVSIPQLLRTMQSGSWLLYLLDSVERAMRQFNRCGISLGGQIDR